ncbi:MAG: translation initiation factor IF-2 [Candidatus Hydrogenedentota bacterium]|nr:MAG: translation initiation factor IF-2 [Candidatus Hydrogenedentota bacterium]
MRIYELARELKVTNKEILEKLPELGIVAKSHASSLSPEDARRVIEVFRPEILEVARSEVAAEIPKRPKAKEGPRPKKTTGKTSDSGKGKEKERKPGERVEPAREKKRPEQVPEEPPTPEKPSIVIREGLTVKELAEKIERPVPELIKKMMALGVMATINQRIALDVAEVVANDYGFEVKREELFKASELATAAEGKEYPSHPRCPVVTVMGHVDHGKTALLDFIRRSNVLAGEAGGITQHVGAYQVTIPEGTITFIDTPGHEAFTAMRARGASVTDIVVLVVAADDGVMPQTEEAIHHAQAAGVPIVVAINKCDLPSAAPQKVKQQLAERNLVPEDWGGDVICVELSAKTGENVDKLLEMILLQAEILELKAPVEGPAEAVVIEAKLDKNRGPVATVIVRRGRLAVGKPFVCGTVHGRVRALMDAEGVRLEKAEPGSPAEVLGFSGVPVCGDLLQEVSDDKEARRIAEERARERREDTARKAQRMTLEDLHRKMKGEEVHELRLVVKADTQGSVEAIRDAIERIEDKRVSLKVLHGSVGAVTDNDVNLAAASDALIIGFGVRPTSGAEALLKREGVQFRYYEIIYKLVEDIREALEGLLAPEMKEELLGRVEVRQVFKISKVGTIAGSYVVHGKIRRGANVRILRDGVVVYTSRIASLKRFKEDVREVGTNFECGIGIENFNDLHVGDILEAFAVREEAQKLDG